MMPGRPGVTRHHPLAPYALAALLAAAAGGLFVSGLPAWAATLALFILLAGTLVSLRRGIRGSRESEQRLRAVVDHAQVGIGRVLPDGRWIDVNPALARMLGYTPEAMQGKTWVEMTHPDDLATSRAAFDAVLRGEQDTYSLEKRYIRGDGSIAETLIHARAIFGHEHRLDYMTVVITDMSERRRVEQALELQVKRAAVLLDLPKRGETLKESEFMQYALEQAESLTGSHIAFMHFVNDDGNSIELVAWSGNTLKHYCHAAYDKHYPVATAGIWADAVRSGKPAIFNDYATAPNRRGLPEGHSQLTRLLSVPTVVGSAVRMVTGVGNKESEYSDFDVETVQLIGNETWRIVNRLRSDHALRLAMQVVDASPVVCFRWQASSGWPVVFVSKNVSQWGYQAADLLAGRPHFADMVHPDDLARVVDEVKRNTAAGLGAYDQEYRLVTADNRVIWVADRTQVLRDDSGTPLYYDGVITDITQRKQQELLLADNLNRLQTLNERLEEAGSQLMQSEKMASIGQLAAGVAHELNNPIGFVHSNLGTLDGYLHDLLAIIEAYQQCLAQRPECSDAAAIARLLEQRDYAFIRDDVFNLVAESKEGLSRVRKIVQDLKSFSRVGEQEWQEADLHQGLDSTLNIVWNELKYKCKVIKEYGDIPPVYCLISQLNQVFMNLLVNAGQAIESQGTITIRTSRQGTDAVCVEVADSGSGIPPENLNRIFDPFFTTKPIGKGTGLGLSLSYNIVRRHHGRIDVSSEPGVGTSFRIILPIRQDNNGDSTAKPMEQSP
ncbi:MAG: PAS domain S-box protein [Dechloromonas sp.]|nr:MAG: PAS domain S-box protein [Dechloromonas sp.]